MERRIEWINTEVTDNTSNDLLIRLLIHSRRDPSRISKLGVSSADFSNLMDPSTFLVSMSRTGVISCASTVLSVHFFYFVFM